ncbi:Ankyrin repeat domain-containing protein 50 [Talaromyces islandicus]|uniref:Ankyrin repeat domain-containing protein 50 n=1 Tax=Talaromyces islandicus TaxID=28573 RepID=A0A0U1LZH1_TALIS|nr:Ankyrin repeat domain-containing protein 50 [Talaromyces islandicus]
MAKKLNHENYYVGWICPLEVEQIAALLMLDERHERLKQPPSDHNVYNLGEINGHNVVIAGLPIIGNTSTAAVVTQMRNTFPNLSFGLLVGIGGGVPVKTDNGMIRLGHVVVSKPTGGHSGAIQYDHGKAKVGEFERTGALAPPPAALLNAAYNLGVERDMSSSDPLDKNINKIDTSIRGLRKFKYPGTAQDHLYKHDYIHPKPGLSCHEAGCDPSQRIRRPAGEDEDSYIVVHRGNIASGERIIKNAAVRDKLAAQYNLLCFETEAAGALVDFPCMVVRGISDYCDSHKNDQWQGYAAAAAAAYARQLFFHLPVSEVRSHISEIAEKNIHHIKLWQDDKDRQNILDWLTEVDYGPRQSNCLGRRQPGTGRWLLEATHYQTWLNTEQGILFCPGIPGAGKTIITSIIIEDLTRHFGYDEEVGIAYVYCDFQQQDHQTTQDLLAALLKHPVANIFATSRFVPDITEKFDGHLSIEIRASEEDIQRYLEGHANELRPFVTRAENRQLLEEIVNVISHTVDGMFLLAQIYLGLLSDKTTTTKIRSSLKQFQDQKLKFGDGQMLEALTDAYKQTMDRITGQKPDLRQLAIQVLSWITCAKRPLTKYELQQALAVEAGDSALDVHNMPHLEDILSVCAGLVTADEESGIVRLVHYTTQEYFEKTKSHWFPIAETNITETCVTYLSFDIFAVDFCLTDKDLKARFQCHILYDYAARNWGYHAREASTKAIQRIICLLNDQVKISGCSYVMEAAGYLIDPQPFRNAVGLHIAAYFGLVQVSSTLLEMGHDLNAKDDYSSTPLFRAAKQGNEAVVKLLLAKDGIDMECKDMRDESPLSAAVKNGHERVVKLLLENGAEPDTEGLDSWTPLWWAAWKGSPAITKMLLEKGANPNPQPRGIATGERTPLSLAADKGHEKIVELLLEVGADPNPKMNPFGRTPLLYAAENGHGVVVKILLEKGAYPDRQHDRFKRTSLSYAAENGHRTVVKLLLETCDIHINSKDFKGRTPLSYAAENGHDEVAQLLLGESDIDLDSKDSDDQTPLLYSAKNGHDKVVKLLLEKDHISLDPRDITERTPLSYAAANGYESVVRLLLMKKQVNPDSRDPYNRRTPLYYAAENGHEEIVKLLLDTNRVDPDKAGGRFGETPLTSAAKNGHAAVVKLLLATDKTDPDSTAGRQKRTPLSFAAEKGYEAVVELLLTQAKVNPDFKDPFNGYTPLYYAAENGHDEVVRLLLATGRVNPDIKSISGQSILECAENSRHEAVVKLLLMAQSSQS